MADRCPTCNSHDESVYFCAAHKDHFPSFGDRDTCTNCADPWHSQAGQSPAEQLSFKKQRQNEGYRIPYLESRVRVLEAMLRRIIDSYEYNISSYPAEFVSYGSATCFASDIVEARKALAPPAGTPQEKP